MYKKMNLTKTILGSVFTAIVLLSGCGGGGSSGEESTLSLTKTKYGIQENSLNVGTLKATQNSVIFSIVGGADKDKFTITQNGELKFINPPDYEDPDDNNKDKIYELTIKLDDGQNSTTQNITVAIININDTNIKWILKTGYSEDSAYGEDRTAIRNSITDINSTVVFASIGSVWEDTTFSAGGGVEVNFEEAKAHCRDLNSINFGGKSDWRLPTRYEIFQIVNYGELDINNTPIDDAFKHFNSKYFWTSNELNQTHAMTLAFYIGYEYPREKNQKKDNYVRCISAPPTIDSNLTKTYNNKIVIDHSTKLMWQDDFNDQDENLTHSQAINYCQNLTLGDYYDWRVPTINELHTIVDYANNKLAFSTQAFSTAKRYFWSSTRSIDDPSGKIYYRYFSLEELTDKIADENKGLSVRCVRNQ